MPGPDKKWDTAAERDLCVAVIAGNQDAERVRHNWPKIHAFMEKLGYGFTREAVSQHFTKVIMKDFKARHGSSTSATSTPTKSSTPKQSTPASSKKRAKPVPEDDDGSNEDQKPKKAKKAKAGNPNDSDGTPVKKEGKRSARERSATVLDNEAAFQNWLASI